MMMECVINSGLHKMIETFIIHITQYIDFME